MARSQAGPIVAVEVFVKQEQIAPVWIFLEGDLSAVHRAATLLITCENANEAIGDVAGHLREGKRLAVRCRRGHGERWAKRCSQLAQRFDQQKRRRKPDRPTPV